MAVETGALERITKELLDSGWSVAKQISIENSDWVVDASISHPELLNGATIYLELLDYESTLEDELVESWRVAQQDLSVPILLVYEERDSTRIPAGGYAWVLFDTSVNEKFPAKPRKLFEKLSSIYNDAGSGTDHDGGTSDLDSRAKNEFTAILNNRDKSRENPFIVLVRGGPDVEVLEKACKDQTWNKCITYRFQFRAVPQPNALRALVEQFLTDLDRAVNNLPVDGRLVHPGDETFLRMAEQVLKSQVGLDEQLDRIVAFIEALDYSLSVGLRLVLMGEYGAIGNVGSLENLGFYGMEHDVLARANERLGIVIAGVPDSLVKSTPDGPLLLESPQGGSPVFHAMEIGEHPFELPDTHAQAFANDVPGGPDKLEIVSEVNAIAETIALEKMEPPLVVGVIGGWGGGKSFVLHLIEKRLREIRAEPLTALTGDTESKDTDNFVGHLYVIRFDAWTFAKSSLWASLMQTILLEFNRQIGIEQSIRDLPEEEEPIVWRLLMELGNRQVRELQDSPLGKKAMDLAREIRSGEPDVAELWGRFEDLRKDEREKLDQAEQELVAASRELAARREKIEIRVNEELDKQARHSSWKLLWGELVRRLGTEMESRFDEHDIDADSFKDLNQLVGFRQRLGLGWNRQSMYFLLFAAAGVIASLLLQSDVVAAALAGGVGLLSGLAGVARIVTTASTWLGERYDAYQQRSGEMRDRLDNQRDSVRDRLLAEENEEFQAREQVAGIPVGAGEDAGEERAEKAESNGDDSDRPVPVTTLEKNVSGLEAKVEEIRRNVGFTADYGSLLELIKGRIDSGYYDEQLGLLHQIQRDLQDLTDALFAEQEGKDTLFPRGKPRIVLLIDDLDRCPPGRVVEVLEAAQLLVKTRLFVIVLAIDVRYITRALEKQYRHVLIRHGEPSGLDYIEKIIQVPYRVRPIQKSAMVEYLSSQMDIETEPEPLPVGESSPGTAAVTPDTVPLASEATRPLKGPAKPDTTTAGGTDDVGFKRPVPRVNVKFQPEEPVLLAECCNAVIVSPRAAKRLINVFKLLKIIWSRRDFGHGPADDVKRCMLMLLAVSARHPVVMQTVLGRVDDEYRKGFPHNKLIYKSLIRVCESDPARSLNPQEWSRAQRIFEKKSVFPQGVTFKEMGPDNFRLVLSFSFVGESDAESEIIASSAPRGIDGTTQ